MEKPRPSSTTNGRSPVHAKVDALVGLKAGALNAADVMTGGLTTEDLATICHVPIALIDGWTANGWLSTQTDADGSTIYRTTEIPLVEAMLEMADYVTDLPTLHANVDYLRARMPELWIAAVAAEYMGTALPLAKSMRQRVALQRPDGEEIDLTFLDRALTRLRNLSPEAQHA